MKKAKQVNWLAVLSVRSMFIIGCCLVALLVAGLAIAVVSAVFIKSELTRIHEPAWLSANAKSREELLSMTRDDINLLGQLASMTTSMRSRMNYLRQGSARSSLAAQPALLEQANRMYADADLSLPSDAAINHKLEEAKEVEEDLRSTKISILKPDGLLASRTRDIYDWTQGEMRNVKELDSSLALIENQTRDQASFLTAFSPLNGSGHAKRMDDGQPAQINELSYLDQPRTQNDTSGQFTTPLGFPVSRPFVAPVQQSGSYPVGYVSGPGYAAPRVVYVGPRPPVYCYRQPGQRIITFGVGFGEQPRYVMRRGHR